MLTDREKDIALMLEARYGDAAAGAFRGGIEVLGHTNDDRMHQSAHSLREVLSMILIHERKSGGKKAPDKKDGKDKQGYGQSLALAASGGLPQSPDDALFKGISDINKSLQSIAHHSGRTPDHKYKGLVGKYVDLLESFLKLHFDALADVERLMGADSPTRGDFERLRELLSKNPSIYEYFFRNAGPSWLARLAEEKYVPPQSAAAAAERAAAERAAAERAAAERAAAEHLASACRAQSEYLARHATENPDLVAGLFASILGLDSGEHYPMVQLLAVRAALAMPPECACRVARQLRPRRGLRPFLRSIAVDETAELAVRLAESGHAEDAVHLAKALLSVRHRARFAAGLFDDIVHASGSAEPEITDYFFSRALKAVAPRLFRAAPIPATKLLAGLLARTARLENMARPEAERDEDLSIHWRPAMEDHSQNPPNDFRSDLAGALAGLLVETGKRSISDLRDALRHLAAKKYPVFRRIELHVYRHFPGYFEGEIAASVGDSFGQLPLCHEYFHLLNSCFPLLPPPARRQYLDRVLGGPGARYMERASELERAGRGPPAEVAARRWKVRHLAPVRDHLAREEKELVGDLALEAGPRHPDFVAYRESVQVGARNARLGGTTPDETIAALRPYRAGEGSAHGGDDTPYAFQDRCESDPLGYSACAAELARLHPRLRAAFIRAMGTASDKGRDVRWDGVLDVCEAAVGPGAGGNGGQGDTAEAADAVAHLLRSALRKNRINSSFKQRVWRVLAATAAARLDGGAPEWGGEAAPREGGGRPAPLDSPGAAAFLAVGEYVAWCFDRSGGKPRLGTEVRLLFESYLDDEEQHTPPRHAAIGHLLPLFYHCDREWVRGRLRSLFGGRSGAPAQAAWAGYLDGNPDYASFEDMARMYRADVASPRRAPAGDDRSFMTYSEQLVNHVTQGHLLGMGDTEDMFDAMVNRSNKNARSHCAWIVHMILKAHSESTCESFNLERFRKIWEGNRLGRHEFLAVWVKFSPLCPGETLRLLHGTLGPGGAAGGSGAAAPMMLVRELQKFAGAHPDMVLACLEDMARDEALHGEIRLGVDELPGMLEKIIKGGSDRERAAALIHRLGEMGYNECGEVLGGGAGAEQA